MNKFVNHITCNHNIVVEKKNSFFFKQTLYCTLNQCVGSRVSKYWYPDSIQRYSEITILFASCITLYHNTYNESFLHVRNKAFMLKSKSKNLLSQKYDLSNWHIIYLSHLVILNFMLQRGASFSSWNEKGVENEKYWPFGHWGVSLIPISTLLRISSMVSWYFTKTQQQQHVTYSKMVWVRLS